MGVTLVLDQRELAHPRIGLAELYAKPLGQPHQDLTRSVEKSCIGGEHHVLGLHRGVDDDLAQLRGLDRPGLGGDR